MTTYLSIRRAVCDIWRASRFCTNQYKHMHHLCRRIGNYDSKAPKSSMPGSDARSHTTLCTPTINHERVASYIYIYICLLLLISMLWHRQAIFESKGDKLSSSAESRIRTHQGLRHQIIYMCVCIYVLFIFHFKYIYTGYKQSVKLFYPGAHNGQDENHQPYDCLLNRFFQAQI